MSEPAARPSTTYGPLVGLLGTLALYFGSQILAAICVLLVALAVFGVGEAGLDDWIRQPLVQAFATLLAGLALVGGVWWLLKIFKTKPAAIGWIAPRLRDLKAAGLGFAVYLPLAVIALSIITGLVSGIDPNQEQQLGFERGSAGYDLWLAFISLVVITPIVEELLVRGFLFAGLRHKLNFLQSALISSGLFAVAHLQFGTGEALLWTAAADTFVMGMVAAYLVEKTSSLWPAIILHTAKNTLAFSVVFVLN